MSVDGDEWDEPRGHRSRGNRHEGGHKGHGKGHGSCNELHRWRRPRSLLRTGPSPGHPSFRRRRRGHDSHQSEQDPPPPRSSRPRPCRAPRRVAGVVGLRRSSAHRPAGLRPVLAVDQALPRAARGVPGIRRRRPGDGRRRYLDLQDPGRRRAHAEGLLTVPRGRRGVRRYRRRRADCCPSSTTISAHGSENDSSSTCARLFSGTCTACRSDSSNAANSAISCRDSPATSTPSNNSCCPASCSSSRTA